MSESGPQLVTIYNRSKKELAWRLTNIDLSVHGGQRLQYLIYYRKRDELDVLIMMLNRTRMN